jgi:carboxylesterase type B
MIDYWTNFARTGNPNKGANSVSTLWPKFDVSQLQDMKFIAPNSIVEQDFKQENCDFWDSIGYHHGW